MAIPATAHWAASPAKTILAPLQPYLVKIYKNIKFIKSLQSASPSFSPTISEKIWHLVCPSPILPVAYERRQDQGSNTRTTGCNTCKREFLISQNLFRILEFVQYGVPFFGYIKHNFNIRTYYCSESTCCKSPSAMEEVTDFHTGWHIQKAAEIGANYFCGLLCVVCTQNTEKYSYELPKTSSKK